MKKYLCILLSLLLLASCASTKKKVISNKAWRNATNNAVKRYSPVAEKQLSSYFAAANMSYPPKKIALLAFKKEREIELWAKDGDWHKVHNYPLTAFSGKLGPKLKENDRQIPEGIYDITSLNPYSSFHLSMMLNYPNAFDKRHGKKDGRKKLGNNIFIHGRAASVGCLAIGDSAIEQLFVLVNKVGRNNAKVIIAPNDFRQNPVFTQLKNQPTWVPNLYANIKQELKPYHA